jgi:hypothetical protein
VRLQFPSRKSDVSVLLVLQRLLEIPRLSNIQIVPITSLFIRLTLSPFPALNLLEATLPAIPYKNNHGRYSPSSFHKKTFIYPPRKREDVSISFSENLLGLYFASLARIMIQAEIPKWMFLTNKWIMMFIPSLLSLF